MIKKNKECDLKSCFLCKLCLPEWLPAIGANRKMFWYKKGAQIFKEGEPLTGMYFIYQGALKVHKIWDADKELIVRFAKKGDIVGHRGLGNEAVYPVSATALEDVTVCYIDLPFFQASLKVNYSFIYELMMFYASELKESEKNMRNLAHMPVKGRIVQALLTLQQRFGKDEAGNIDLTFSRQDLASFAGTTYETVFRILNELVKENMIALSSKSVLIIDSESLAQLITNYELRITS